MDKNFCLGTSAIWRFMGYVLFVIKIGIPLIIIIIGTIELGKCITTGKEDEIKTSFQKLLKKVIIGILIFLIPSITKIVFRIIDEASESMIYAKTCLICLTEPNGEMCQTAVETAAEYRENHNKELYNTYYQILEKNDDKVEYKGEKSGGNPVPLPETDDPTSTPSDNPINIVNPSNNKIESGDIGVNSFSFKASSGTSFNYWVVTPSNLKIGMPLIVFLHGGGNDITAKDYYTPEQMFNKLVTIDHPYSDVANIYGSNFPFVLLIPHNYNSWYGGYEELYELINYVADTYYINTNKISITGVSNGGVGAWNFVNLYPNLPSCVYIVSGPQSVTNLNPENFKNIPIKGISETNNGYYSVMEVNCQKINALGGSGSCEITPRSDMTHDTILSVSYPKEIFEWMISNSK